MTELILTYLSYMLFVWLSAANILAAALVIYDKHISKLPRGSITRVPEKAFVRFSMLGGGVGTLLAMLMIHHKTRSHDGLLLKVAALTVLWIAALCALFTYFN